MHLHKFAEMAQFAEIGIGGCFYATESYRLFFKKLHPAQFLNSEISIPVYEVSYSYVTSRGNHRQAKKYMFLRSEHEELAFEVEMALNDWVEDFNRKRPYRKISNVKILEIRPTAYAKLQIGM